MITELTKGNTAWIGLHDQHIEERHQWEWVGTSHRDEEVKLDFTYWMKGQPDNNSNEDCTALVGKESRWNDLPCAYRAQFVCEKRGNPEDL